MKKDREREERIRALERRIEEFKGRIKNLKAGLSETAPTK